MSDIKYQVLNLQHVVGLRHECDQIEVGHGGLWSDTVILFHVIINTKYEHFTVLEERDMTATHRV